ncbi:hypothetical protein ZWY2020_057853 [Hordeum vulgare]|nr:hypothetical protein ZWY2020_057853 [Hordeum vulgare]
MLSPTPVVDLADPGNSDPPTQSNDPDRPSRDQRPRSTAPAQHFRHRPPTLANSHIAPSDPRSRYKTRLSSLLLPPLLPPPHPLPSLLHSGNLHGGGRMGRAHA